MGKQVDLAVYNEWTYAVKGRAMERRLNLRAMMAEFVGECAIQHWIPVSRAHWRIGAHLPWIWLC